MVLIAGCKGKSTHTNLDQVDWLNGFWERTNTKAGTSAHERWIKNSETGMNGWGVAMRDNDTTFVESLRIVLENDELYYVADVEENPEPVFFKFTSMTSNGFITENPDHDFPKKIEYLFKNDTLVVTTSGDNQKITFKFVRRNR